MFGDISYSYYLVTFSLLLYIIKIENLIFPTSVLEKMCGLLLPVCQARQDLVYIFLYCIVRCYFIIVSFEWIYYDYLLILYSNC